MSYQDLKELLKDAKNIAEGANDLQLKSKLLDIQSEIFELQEENSKLRRENEELKNKKIDASKIEWKDNAYYPKDGSDNIYCPRCFDKESNLINMIKLVLLNTTHYSAKCPECKTTVETDQPHGQNTTLNF